MIVLVEHFVFRKNDWTLYNMADWNRPRRLPWGVAALLAFGCAFAIIIPSMSQVWYTGPIALHAGKGPSGGDVGPEQGFAYAFVAYALLRPLELRYFGR